MLIPMLEKLGYIVFLAALVGWMTLPGKPRESIEEEVIQPLRDRRKYASGRFRSTEGPTRRE